MDGRASTDRRRLTDGMGCVQEARWESQDVLVGRLGVPHAEIEDFLLSKFGYSFEGETLSTQWHQNRPTHQQPTHQQPTHRRRPTWMPRLAEAKGG